MTSIDRAELSALAQLVTGQTSASTALSENTNKDLLTRLDHHGISTLVQPQHLAPSLQTELAQRKPLMVANEALRKKELEHLFSSFQQQGLTDYLVFKGTALAYSEYQHPWQRPRSDTDLLITKEQLHAFSAAFQTLGYERLFSITGEYISYQATFGKHLIGKATINIDVHWRINNRQCLANAYSLTQLLDDAASLSAFSTAPKIPNQVDSLIIACLHRLGHHHKEERLAWLYDIHLLANKLNAEQWQIMLTKAANKKLSAICLNGLSTTQRYFATHIPSQVIDELNALAAQPESSQLFLNRNASDLALMANDVKSINGLSGKVRFVIENVFPPADYMKKQMGTRSLISAYLLRFWRGLKRLSG